MNAARAKAVATQTGCKTMKTTETLDERVFSPVGVEARYPAPKAWIDRDSSKSWIRRMWPVMWAHKRYFLAAWIATFVAILIGLASPARHKASRERSDAARHRARADVGALMAGLAVARFLVGMVSRQGMMRAAYGIEYDLRSIIYEHLTRMSFAFYDRVQTGQLISRANSDIRSVQMFLAFAPTMVIQFLTFFVAAASCSRSTRC